MSSMLPMYRCFHNLVFLLAIGTLSPLIQSYSQNPMYTFEHYTEANGLSAPVEEITQDHFGYLWLATHDGLNRLDGNYFKVFRNKLGDTNSIPNNIINQLCVHPDGKILIATNGGLCYFSYQDDRFHQIAIPDSLELSDRYRIHHVVVDPFGQIWFSTKTKVHLLSPDFKIEKSIDLKNRNSYSITEFQFDSDNHLFLGLNNGELVMINLCNGIEKSVFIHTNESINLKLVPTVGKMYPVSKSVLYVCSWYGGLNKVVYSDTGLTVNSFMNLLEDDLQKNVVLSLIPYKSDQWWIATYGAGIALFDPVESKYKSHLKFDIANPNGPGSNYINDMYMDRNGIIWLGTSEGLDKYDPIANQFFSIRIPIRENEKSIYRRPSSIVECSDTTSRCLWIAVPGVGLFKYNRQTHQFKFASLKDINGFPLEDDKVYSVFYNKLGELLLCMNQGVFIMDTASYRIKLIQSTTPMYNCRRMIQDFSGNYWISSSGNGFYYLNNQTKALQHFEETANCNNCLQDNSIFCMIQDHSGKIWIGTQNRGLSCYDPLMGNFKYYERIKNMPRSLPDNNIYDLYEDPDNYIWIATENGLARMDPDRTEFKIITTAEGLSNNDIFSITTDKVGKLWLATNHGLSVLNPKDGSINLYSEMDGISSNRMDGSAFCCSDGELWFGTNNMITGCNPSTLLKNAVPPVVKINAIRVLGKELPLLREGNKLKDITLSYRKNVFSPEFIALNYTNSSKNKYAYILEGYDRGWNYCGSQTSTTYTNLPGGVYTFKIKASNNDGVWSVGMDEIHIIVKPPFWNTIWFFLLILAFIVLTVFLYFRIKFQQLIKLQKLRLDIARDLHDEVGSTLSSIHITSSMSEQITQRGKDPDELFKFIKSASSKALEMMGEIIWSVKPENDKPEMMFNRMRQYTSDILEPAGIDFTFQIDDRSLKTNIPLNYRKDLFMFFKEALNNMAKYSRTDTAEIIIQSDRSELILIIKDHGEGFDTEKNYSGNGLKNMRARAMAMRTIFRISSEKGIGCTIELILKIKKL